MYIAALQHTQQAAQNVLSAQSRLFIHGDKQGSPVPRGPENETSESEIPAQLATLNN